MLWRRVLSISISYIILYCLLTNFYIGAPIFPLQLKCKLCWSELTLESQHTPVTRAVFHQISTDWQHTKYRIPKYIKYCKQQKKKEIKHQTYWWIIDNNKLMIMNEHGMFHSKLKYGTIIIEFSIRSFSSNSDFTFFSSMLFFPQLNHFWIWGLTRFMKLRSSLSFFPSDIYKLSFSKWSVNVSNFPDDLFPEGWETFGKSFFKSSRLEKEVRKMFLLYFPHGIHKFDFPIWIQGGNLL